MTIQSTRADRWSGARRDLLHRRSRLIRSVRAGAGIDDAGSTTLGETEHLVVYEQRRLDATLDAMQRRELDRIEVALARIAEDRYGTCETCGEPIRPERLEAIPTATTCVGCSGRVPG